MPQPLSDTTLANIKFALASGASWKKIQKRFRVSSSTISRARKELRESQAAIKEINALRNKLTKVFTEHTHAAVAGQETKLWLRLLDLLREKV